MDCFEGPAYLDLNVDSVAHDCGMWRTGMAVFMRIFIVEAT